MHYLIGVACYLLIGAALVVLLSWRRPDLFRYRDQFFAAMAYALALVWPVVAVMILFRLMIFLPGELLAKRAKDRQQT